MYSFNNPFPPKISNIPEDFIFRKLSIISSLATSPLTIISMNGWLDITGSCVPVKTTVGIIILLLEKYSITCKPLSSFSEACVNAFLVPLGDLVNRRRLMAIQLMALISALLMVAFAHSTIVLLTGMLAVGLLGTAMTQGLIAYAASAAAPHEQGHVVGTAQSGVFIGLLLARVFSGGISDIAGWRGVYFCAAIIMLMITLPLWRRLPHLNVQPVTMRYPQLLASMLKLLRQEKVLQVRGVLALLMFAAFNILWSALVLPLSAPPYNFSHTVIGSFGLFGVIRALAATRAGQWADRGYAQRTSLAALLILLLAWWPLSLMTYSLWALVIGIVLLDLGGQALHVTNQSMIFRTRPEAHSRLVGLYMLFYAVGSGLGAISTTATYAYAGWLGVCGLGACVSLLALLFWWRTIKL